jgi:hypothetical protein
MKLSLGVSFLPAMCTWSHPDELKNYRGLYRLATRLLKYDFSYTVRISEPGFGKEQKVKWLFITFWAPLVVDVSRYETSGMMG